MEETPSTGPRPAPRPLDERAGIDYLLGEMGRLHARGLVGDDAHRAIVEEYSARREAIDRSARFAEAVARARDLAVISPREAADWAARAREARPDRPEGWARGVALLRRLGRFDEADRLDREMAGRFPDLARPTPVPATRAPIARVEAYLADRAALAPPSPTVSWSSVAGEFLQEHWQKLISALAVLLIVVSSTVGASLVLGPLLWSPAGKGVLGLAFTALCAGFGLGLARWGAERAGRVMMATSLFVVPINFMLLGELGLMANPSTVEAGLVALDAALLLALARGVVGALGLPSAGAFTASFFGLAIFNAGATRGMPGGTGLAVFLAPCAVFLAGVAWLDRRVGLKGGSTRADHAYLGLGLLAFAFLAGVLRTGVGVLHLVPALYAIPAMLAAIAAVSTARAVAAIEKDRRVVQALQQGGLTLSALAFALALARPPGPSALFSGNTLAVAVLGLALYATSLRATRLPAYLYCGFAALFLAYFGTFYFAADLVRTVEDAARRALGYDRKLPMPFKAINGLAFNLGLAWLARFFERRWSDDRLARHCHYIGLPLSVAACVLSGFEPKAAVICLTGYAALYALGSRAFAEPRLVDLACWATVGAAFFASSLAPGWATIEARSLLASGLGLVFWLVRAGMKGAEAYRTPLLRSSRVLAVVAMASAAIGSGLGGTIAPAATLAFLLAAILALLNGREAPRLSVYLVAVAGLLGAWLGGYHGLMGGSGSSMMAHGLAVAGFAAALTLAGEAVLNWLEGSDPADAFVDAVGWSVPVLVLASWGLAGWAGVDSVTVARAFLVGGASLLWLTRLRREGVLMYLGLMGLVTWAACLCGLVVAGGWGSARLESWLGVTMAGCALACWAVGEWSRRRGSDFYAWPCLLMAGVLAVMGSGLAVEARWISVDSYRVGVAAMLAASAALGLVAWSGGWRSAVGLATASAVGASYLALVSQRAPDPRMAWVLALVAAVESIACRGVATLVRRAARDPNSPMARPLDYWALALLAGAIPLGLGSPPTLLAIAAATLLMVGGFPSGGWLYATSLALIGAAYRGWLWDYPADGLVPFAVFGAYAWWALAVLARRVGPRSLARLGLPDLKLHAPPVRVAIGLGVLAATIRAGEVVAAGGAGWSDLAWLPWALSVLCLLMLRFESSRGWVHLAVGLSGLGFAATVEPWAGSGAWRLSTAMALACLWWLAGRGVDRFEGMARRRGWRFEGHGSGVVEGWSLATAAVTGVALAVVVVFGAFAPSLGELARWPDGVLAIGLAVAFLGLEGRRWVGDSARIGLEAAGLLACWWPAAPGSPTAGWLGVDRDDYLPLATAAYALGVVWLGLRAVERSGGGVVDPSEPPPPPRGLALASWTSGLGFGLGLASAYFSIGAGGRVAPAALLVGAVALGLLALGWHRVESAVLGGILWCLACPLALAQASRELGRSSASFRAEEVGVGLAVGVFSLWWASGRVRRAGEGKGGDPAGSGKVASALEWVAIEAAVPAALAAMLPGQPTAWVASGLLAAMAAFFALVAVRRRAEWPVYLAQGLVLVGYFHARMYHFDPGAADPFVLSILAYLDLGASELATRLGWRPFARPTLVFAMGLPLVPILVGVAEVGWGDLNLFVVLATAGFYALAAARLGSKGPGYASAVFLNGFLWLAWHRLGWRVADSPQFYLIPVGFSTILLGEVNRRELGRSVVNGLRNLGLVVMYASLATPIWQAQSFGAWLALLLLSLAGVFAGIGLRVQSFLWLGLACFVADVTYQLGRLGVEHALARWGVMLGLGVALILFVALNEKRRIVATLRGYYDEARSWE